LLAAGLPDDPGFGVAAGFAEAAGLVAATDRAEAVVRVSPVFLACNAARVAGEAGFAVLGAAAGLRDVFLATLRVLAADFLALLTTFEPCLRDLSDTAHTRNCHASVR